MYKPPHQVQSKNKKARPITISATSSFSESTPSRLPTLKGDSKATKTHLKTCLDKVKSLLPKYPKSGKLLIKQKPTPNVSSSAKLAEVAALTVKTDR